MRRIWKSRRMNGIEGEEQMMRHGEGEWSSSNLKGVPVGDSRRMRRMMRGHSLAMRHSILTYWCSTAEHCGALPVFLRKSPQ